MRIFRMGASHWLGLDYWSPQQATYRRICRSVSVKESETSPQDEGLSFEPPAKAAQPDRLPTPPAYRILSVRACEHSARSPAPGPSWVKGGEARILQREQQPPAGRRVAISLRQQSGHGVGQGDD